MLVALAARHRVWSSSPGTAEARRPSPRDGGGALAGTRVSALRSDPAHGRR